MDEFERIRRMTKMFTIHAGGRTEDGIEVGIGDDAAVVRVNDGTSVVAACDTMVETVHFSRATMNDSDIGFKALAANVSDIAAMGAIPTFALVSVSIPRRWLQSRIDRIYSGIHACAASYGVRVIGGDTTLSPRHLTVSVTILGEVESGKALRRSSARPGDAVFIVGEPGLSAAGLHYMLNEWTGRRAPVPHQLPQPYARMTAAHQRPQPNVEAGRLVALAGGTRCSLNDISDGVASECMEISRASGYAIELYDDRLPVAPELAVYAERTGRSAWDWILYGGEDYGLVGTVPASRERSLRNAMERRKLRYAVVGEVTSSRTRDGALYRIDVQGNRTQEQQKGYTHFV